MAGRNGDVDERVAAAHAVSMASVEAVASGDDFRRLLSMASRFHKYSPQNSLLLAAQGAEGYVGSYRFWTTVPSMDGQMCQVRKDEKAVRVFAPIPSRQRQVDELTGEEFTAAGPTRFRLVPVFHEGQLVAPPAWPLQPKLLVGGDEITAATAAVVAAIEADGFAVERGPVVGHPGANGVTIWDQRRVVVRDDVDPAQGFKTLVHELAHVRLHRPGVVSAELGRAVKEVEAESVAFVVCQAMQIDSATYSIPYVVSWAGGDADVVRSAAERSLAAAGRIIAELESALSIDLTPDPAEQLRVSAGTVAHEVAVPCLTDATIAAVLAADRFDWPTLVEGLSAIDREHALAASTPTQRATVLVEAGASASAVVAVLAAEGLTVEEAARVFVSPVADTLGESIRLFPTAQLTAVLVDRYGIDPAKIDALIAATTAVIEQAPVTAAVDVREVDRDATARRLLTSDVPVAEKVRSIVRLAEHDPVGALRLASMQRDGVAPVVAGVIERLELEPATAASMMRAAGIRMEDGVESLLLAAPPREALVAMRNTWPGHDDATWLHLATHVAPRGVTIPRALESITAEPLITGTSLPSAVASSAELGSSLIKQWATIPTVDTSGDLGHDLIKKWASIPATHVAPIISPPTVA